MRFLFYQDCSIYFERKWQYKTSDQSNSSIHKFSKFKMLKSIYSNMNIQYPVFQSWTLIWGRKQCKANQLGMKICLLFSYVLSIYYLQIIMNGLWFPICSKLEIEMVNTCNASYSSSSFKANIKDMLNIKLSFSETNSCIMFV